MNKVSFPGLGLSFSFSSIAFSIFNINIYWYSICIVLGIIVALILCKLSTKNFGINFIDVIDVAIISIVFGIIGARIYYVAFNLDYYLAKPIRILQIRDGGLGIYGGLILGGIAGIFRTKKLEINPYDLFDYIAPYVSIAQSIGRWGNFFNVEAYGIKTNNILRMKIQNKIEVHPTFLYESIATFVIFCMLRSIQKNKKFDGQILLLYIILYSGVRFCIEGLRSDSLMLYNFKASQIVSVFAFVISIYFYLKKKNTVHN